jgi:signal recognition particle receptor subunit beta
MALINHAKKEINAKIVYFGPAKSGKSTALTYIYSRIKPSLRGDLKSVPASEDNLLFFDFSPFDAPLANGYRFRLHIYTLTGIVTNPATWRMTLKGADGIMIMADPADERIAETRESIAQLRDFLAAYGVGLHETPTLLQLNDTSENSLSVQTADVVEKLELIDLPYCRSNSVTSEGLLEALTILSRQVLDRVMANKQREVKAEAVEEDEPNESGDTVNSSVDIQADQEIRRNVDIADKTCVTFLPNELSVNGTTLRIPIDIQCGENQSRFVVTVAIESIES